MLFKQQFHAGIRDGSITRTYRTWATPRVKVGGRYRLGPADAVEVDRIDTVALGKIPAVDAKRCGFDSRDALVAAIQKFANGRLTARSPIVRVTFHHVQVEDPRIAKREDASRAALDDVQVRLGRMDRLSRKGPWTYEVLQLIADHPKVVASELAIQRGLERRVFKADVRKLKGLGLTISHGVGYTLSKRGRAVLKRGRPVD